MGLLTTVKAQSSGKVQDDQQLEHASRWSGGQYQKENKEVSQVLNMTNFGVTDVNTKS